MLNTSPKDEKNLTMIFNFFINIIDIYIFYHIYIIESIGFAISFYKFTYYLLIEFYLYTKFLLFIIIYGAIQKQIFTLRNYTYSKFSRS